MVPLGILSDCRPHADAVDLSVTALAAMRRVQGASHPTTIDLLKWLAAYYDELNRAADAQALRNGLAALRS